MPRIKFMPQGVEVQGKAGASILELVRSMGGGVRAECGGKGACGSCRVYVEPVNSFSAPSEHEQRVLGDDLDKGQRLACHTKVLESGTVIIPPASRTEQVIVLEESYGSLDLDLKPAVRQLFLQISEPTMTEPSADGQRLLQIIQQHTVHTVSVEPAIIQRLPKILREQQGQICATLWQDRSLLDLTTGYRKPVLGVAVDIGTTTMVAFLFDLRSGQLVGRASGLNPQTTYGADVITRIHFASETGEARRRLQSILVDELNELISLACEKAGVKPVDVFEAVVVGNTAMHHLFLGIETRYLAQAPYVPVWSEPLDWPARSVGLKVHPAANLHVLPNKAGFVGADSMAVLLALEPYLHDELQLIIDFGTNGEMLLANRHQMWACSTAAGPAFEGAKIRCGMRAQEGAIDHVELEHVSQKIRWRSIGSQPPLGICGSGLIAAIAALRKAGVLEASGRFNSRLQDRNLRPGSEGLEYVLAWPEETATGDAVVITQEDVRQVQLGKAAVAAGCLALLNHAQAKMPDNVVLAGAFGSYIQPEAAKTIGLIPDLSPEKIKVVGNAAGRGACLALLNVDKREEIALLAPRVEYIELSAEPDFQGEFIRSTRLQPWGIANPINKQPRA